MERTGFYFNKLIKSLKSEKNKGLKGLKPKKQAGFSLIELLVSISILVTLAAIAIPSYNGYRKHTAWTVLDSEGASVQRAFMACVAAKSFDQCNSLAELGVNTNNITAVVNAPNFCVSLEKEIAGYKFQGCYSANASDGTQTNQVNLDTCYMDLADNRGNTKDCVAGDGVYQPNCDRQALPLTHCATNQDCIEVGVGTVCSSSRFLDDPLGVCNTNATCY